MVPGICSPISPSKGNGLVFTYLTVICHRSFGRVWGFEIVLDIGRYIPVPVAVVHWEPVNMSPHCKRTVIGIFLLIDRWILTVAGERIPNSLGM